MKRISGPVDGIVKKVPTHYEILQVIESSTEEVINEAYETLLDKFQTCGNAELIGKTNLAFNVLSDSQQRKDYDNKLQQDRSRLLIDEIPHRHVFYQEMNIKQKNHVSLLLKERHKSLLGKILHKHLFYRGKDIKRENKARSQFKKKLFGILKQKVAMTLSRLYG